MRFNTETYTMKLFDSFILLIFFITYVFCLLHPKQNHLYFYFQNDVNFVGTIFTITFHKIFTNPIFFKHIKSNCITNYFTKISYISFFCGNYTKP